MLIKLLVTLFFIARLTEVHSANCTFQSIPPDYICTIFGQIIQTEEDMKIPGGVHVPGFGDAQVTSLRASFSVISVFPSLIIDRFLNLRSVQMSSVGLNSFGSPVTNCRALNSITMSGNSASVLPGRIFQNCFFLQELVMIQNFYNSIDINAFAGLSNLQTLRLSGASLPSLNTQIFAPLTSLTTLEVSFSGILNMFPPLQHYPRLTSLNLRFNNLSLWTQDFLANNPQVTTLLLEGNQFATLRGDEFANLLALNFLSIGSNLQSLPVFSILPQLLSFNLNGNQLQNVSAEPFENLFRLRELSLAFNQIEAVNFTMRRVSFMKTLEHLRLHTNRIENIQDFAFSMLTALKRLDLDDNSLTHLSANSLQPIIRTLHYLELSNNRIETIDRDLLAATGSLHIRMGGNVCHSSDVLINNGVVSDLFERNCLSFASKFEVNVLVAVVLLALVKLL